MHYKMHFPIMRYTVVLLLSLTLGFQSLNAQIKLLNLESLDTKEIFYTLLDALETPQRVYRLDLSGKKLTEIPPEIFSFPNLQELNLSQNNITVLPEGLEKIPYLQVLNLSQNKIFQAAQCSCYGSKQTLKISC